MGLSPLDKKKRLKALKLSNKSMDIDEMIRLASRKLYPIIEMLADNSKNSEHFLSRQQFDDAIKAANLIKDISKILTHAEFRISTRNADFALENYKVTLNDQGKIYVETPLLLQLIDLYNILEDTKDTIDEFYKSLGTHSFVQTESGRSICSEESVNPNRIVLRLTKALTKSSTSLGMLSKNFIVMPSTTDETATPPLRESKSDISMGSEKNAKNVSTKRVKSTGSLVHEKISEITDVRGAKRVVVRCICDLQEVSKFLSSEQRNAATSFSRVKADGSPSSTSDRTKVNKDGGLQSTEDDKSCCCPECLEECVSRANLQECNDDKVIICIKGCNEDEGDVQIVIRQCTDCKNAEVYPVRTDKSVSPIKSQPNQADSTAESVSLHNKDSQGSYVCSEEEDDDGKIQKFSLRPSRGSRDSISAREIDSNLYQQSNRGYLSKTTERKPISSKQSSIQQSRVTNSKIRMFETTNLCLETDTGQELIISVTVTPKEFEQKKLSLRDIFSEDEYARQGQVVGKRRTSTDSEGRRSVSLYEPQQASNYYEDRVIPLGRTKICSSVDFDVTTLPTRIRDKGIQHKNAKIVIQLRDLGVENLLRACRPAKCCRKAVLNEKMKKCLPYAPSLKSLPLDQKDMEVINESLQMSLQKVKNSTNLKKDFYTTYSMKPIKTIMYFIVEQTKNNLKSSGKNDVIRQKLSYYINLVNDIELKPSSTFNILYFGVEETSDKNLPEAGKKNSDRGYKNIHSKHLANVKSRDALLNSSKWRKDKYNKYEEIPMLTGNIGQNCSSSINRNEDLIKTCSKIENDQIQKQSEISNQSYIKGKKKIVASRIPVYKGNNRSKYFNTENNYNIEQTEKEVYGISLDSLPRGSDVLKEGMSSGSKSSSLSIDKPGRQEELRHKEITTQIKPQVCPPKSTETSRYSVLSNYVSRKTKRKKKSFYLSRSMSDISLNILKNKKYKYTAKTTQTKIVSKGIFSNRYSQKMSSREISTTNTPINTQDSSNLILNYFSRMLYKMIVRQALNEQKLQNLIRNKNNKENCSETTDKRLYELYKRLSNRNNGFVNNLEIKPVDVISTHHNLKAKKSQSSIVIASKNKNKICIINNLAIQTSVLFIDSKQCQTSKSLLPYFIKPKIKPEETTYLQKKRVFKKIYNNEALSGIPNSCDQLEKFIVIFRSEHSLKSNLSNNTDFLLSVSEPSERSFENISEQIISKSLLQLKETLEKYETVKNEITHGSLETANVNPIEYFVYQMCACNRVNKKPSLMKKMLSKSKGLFSSVEKDICTKYSNQMELRNIMSSADKRLCYQCGCLMSQCGAAIPSHKEVNNSSALCQCPPDNKPKKPPGQPCCKNRKNSKTTSHLSKITSASISSVRSLRTYFKKSLSNIKARSKEKGLGPCSCDKPKVISQNVETICIPDGVSVEVCTQKDTSTGTTKDSTTQKCECTKCENFSDDGTCCCSHCLGCLDKSFDAKPDNNNIATLCKCIENPLSSDNSKNNGHVTDLVMSVNSIKTSDNMQSADKEKSNIGVSNTNEPSAMSKNDININSVINKNPPQDKNSTTSAPNSSKQMSNDKKLNSPASSANQRNEEVASIENNDDTTSYYFLTSPPNNMFNQFGLGTRNPFEQYLLNMPNINMFRLDNPQTFFKE